MGARFLAADVVDVLDLPSVAACALDDSPLCVHEACGLCDGNCELCRAERELAYWPGGDAGEEE